MCLEMSDFRVCINFSQFSSTRYPFFLLTVNNGYYINLESSMAKECSFSGLKNKPHDDRKCGAFNLELGVDESSSNKENEILSQFVKINLLVSSLTQQRQ
jgi:hypothetical protein